MRSELIIGIGGLVLSIMTYFAGVYRTERRLNDEDRMKRIEGVFDRYMEFRDRNITGGLDGLVRAGVATLKDNSEILELENMIISHGEKPPLGKNNELSGKDLKVFFDYAIKNGVSFLKTPVEDVIRESGA